MAHILDRGREIDRRWQARYRDPDGREKSKTFARKLDAGRWLDAMTADLVTGRYVDPKAGQVTLEDFAGRWLASQTFDESSRESVETRIRIHMVPTLGKIELRNLKPSMVQSWLRGLDLAPSYVKAILSNLSSIMRAAMDDGLIGSNPCSASSVKAPAVEKRRVIPWTVEQVQTVIEGHRDRWRAVPTIAAGCGLRQGEVFGLSVDDVDFLRRRILVRQQVKVVAGKPILAPPKGKKEREVPLPDVVAVAISEHLRAYRGKQGAVFSNDAGNLVSRASYNRNQWHPALTAAGIEPSRDTGMHALRHHYASVLLDGGVSIRPLAEYLGHSDPGFTLRVYAHLMPDSEDRARAVVDAAFSAAIPAESVLNAR